MADTRDQGKSGYLDQLPKALKRVHPELTLGKSAATIIDQILASVALNIRTRYNLKQQVQNKVKGEGVLDRTKRQALEAVSESLGTKEDSLHKHANSEAIQVLQKKRKPVFTLTTASRYKGVGSRTNTRAILTGALGYLAEEIMELAGNKARDRGSKSITRKDVEDALKDDPELFELFIPLSKIKKNAELAEEVAVMDRASGGKSPGKQVPSKSPLNKISPKPTTTSGRKIDDMTVEQLYAEAQRLKIPGRSKLRKEGKASLLAAVKEANSANLKK
jgi:hypothetical protein